MKTKKEITDWVVKLWESGEDELIKRFVSDNFYLRLYWVVIRKFILKKYGKICMKCGSSEFHQIFKEYRQNREWFLANERIKCFIKKMYLEKQCILFFTNNIQ